ncbi:NAD(P)H-dependent glycerol-3-phosphate dehydrogenase [Cohaesibacter celericrescens]|uniref:Glycerol-3-phosphate dehydrogenase [NAD(P)+] n=1 Tax=Cohaesibacter celericrescens TaxID=2067669 RepID=A0A2N5XPD5_9HYPH|nr:NAD(P)H-dependent glycerol-3-phosphate dehydrogenase [Cohaesibacter celericrescens]PLW76288.1 glycerol-3-phosphate dehydrogenase [Cohaesibacter celericrescens]
MSEPSAPKPFQRVSVLGAGAWGTALALNAARAGRDVVLWGRNQDNLNTISTQRQLPPYLPGLTFDHPLETTTDVTEAADADCILIVAPAQVTHHIAEAIGLYVRKGTPVILAAKGLEKGTQRMMSEVLADYLPQAQPAILSGPSFAFDVARGLPTAVTIAARTAPLAEQICATLSNKSFRPYASTDLIGVQLGGALKNVLAIACGIVMGKELGASAHAALMTRGFAEMQRLALKLGARPDTLMGLSGFGDVTLSCSSPQSRNFSFGYALGQGTDLSDLMAPGAKLSEGAYTARVACELAEKNGVDMPIAQAVADVLDRKDTIDKAVSKLMTRPLRRESDHH